MCFELDDAVFFFISSEYLTVCTVKYSLEMKKNTNHKRHDKFRWFVWGQANGCLDTYAHFYLQKRINVNLIIDK